MFRPADGEFHLLSLGKQARWENKCQRRSYRAKQRSKAKHAREDLSIFQARRDERTKWEIVNFIVTLKIQNLVPVAVNQLQRLPDDSRDIVTRVTIFNDFNYFESCIPYRFSYRDEILARLQLRYPSVPEISNYRRNRESHREATIVW